MMKIVTASGTAAKMPARNVLRRCLLRDVMAGDSLRRMRRRQAFGSQPLVLAQMLQSNIRMKRILKNKGALVVLGLFVFGGLALAGLFLAPRPTGPGFGSPLGTPSRPIRF